MVKQLTQEFQVPHPPLPLSVPSFSQNDETGESGSRRSLRTVLTALLVSVSLCHCVCVLWSVGACARPVDHRVPAGGAERRPRGHGTTKRAGEGPQRRTTRHRGQVQALDTETETHRQRWKGRRHRHRERETEGDTDRQRKHTHTSHKAHTYRARFLTRSLCSPPRSSPSPAP